MAFSSYSSLNYIIVSKKETNSVINPSYWLKFNSGDISGTTILNYGSSQKNGYIATDNSGTLPTLGTSTINGIVNCGVINLNETYKNYVNMTTTLGTSSTYFTIGAGTTGLSISCWFNYANFSVNYMRIFDFTTAINSIANSCLLASNYNSSSQLFVENYNASKSQYNGIAMTTNTWYHLVWTITSGGVWSVYLNNVLQSMTPASVSSYPSITQYQYACLGRPSNNTSNPTQYFSGMLSDFRTYNYALSTSDIAYLYNNPV